MNGAIRSIRHVGCASLHAAIVVAFLLAGQFFTLSHSVDHDSGHGDCVVCRISKPHKQAVSFIDVAPAVPARSTEAVLAQTPDDLKPITCDTQQKRAPPTPS